MALEREASTQGLLDALREFRNTVPVAECWRVMKMNRWDILIPAVLSVGIALLDAMSLLFLIPLLSLLSGSDDALLNIQGFDQNQKFGLLTFALVVAGLFKAALSYWLHLRNGEFYQRASTHLCNHLFERLLRFGRGYFQHNSQSELWSLLDSRHQLLQLFLALQRLVLNSALLTTHLLVLLFISWPLTALLAVLLPIFHFSLQAYARRTQQKTQASQNEVGALYPKLFTVFSNLDLYRNHCREDLALSSFGRCNEQIREASLESWKLEGTVERTREVLSLFALILLLLLTSQLVSMKPGLLLNYLIFFFIVKNSLPLLGSYQQVAMEFHQKLPGARTFAEAFTEEGKYRVKEGTRNCPNFASELSFQNLTFGYSDNPIFENISFSLPKGTTTAIVGPSGTGKTSLLQLLMRSYEYQGGDILIDSESIRSFTHHSLRDKISFLGQDAPLLRASLRENLLFSTDEEIADDRLLELLESVQLSSWVEGLEQGLDTLMSDLGTTVSAGQKQRIALARCLLRDTDVYLFDEATSSLDPITEVEVDELIRATTREKTTLLVTHRLDSLAQVDQIVVLDQGGVAQRGTFSELSAQDGLFKTMIEAKSGK